MGDIENPLSSILEENLAAHAYAFKNYSGIKIISIIWPRNHPENLSIL